MPFSPDDRAHLLAASQIGPRLVAQLEAAGFDSLAQMRRAGAEAVMRAVCQRCGHASLANRVGAIRRALEVAPTGADGVPDGAHAASTDAKAAPTPMWRAPVSTVMPARTAA